LVYPRKVCAGWRRARLAWRSRTSGPHRADAGRTSCHTEFAGERLARVICADREILDDAGVSAIADAIAEAQIDQVAGAIRRVCARHGSLRTAVVTGLGAFIAKTAACRAGLSVASLANHLGADAARYAPAAAVALLLDAEP
jgi:uncharacterized hydantoinase/oxoprolinase family protein